MFQKIWPLLGILAFWLGLASPAAQTAAEMDSLLENQAISYSDAARFVLPAAGVLPNNVGAQAAFDEALSRGWLPKGAAASDEANLGGISFLVMKAFGIKGGLMYTLFPGPRYAYRQLLYRKLIQGRVDPGMKVGGDYFLYVVGRVLDFLGETGEANG
ncbi:hypothetical protein [Leadbettera azotonutricia]|nr:hypothetical protein [Leadbettera azotonutricia]